MTPPIYDRVALIGLGLIASSMAHAMKQFGLVGEIVGYAKTEETRRVALEIGICDRVFGTAAEAVQGADLVVLAVPVGAMAEIAAEIGPHLAQGACVTDVGSVKQAVIAAVGPHIPEGVAFVPAHPLAGTEHSGPRSGFATLFQNRWCLLTPTEQSIRLWEKAGQPKDLVLITGTDHFPLAAGNARTAGLLKGWLDVHFPSPKG